MASQSLEGQTIGKYRVLEALGRGGMAQVYKAYHPQLDRYVAIKVLRSDLVEEHEFLARFRREAHAVSGLRHPNIVQVFDFDVQDEIYYMIMELLEGDTLRARLNNYRVRGERMPIPEVLRITKDILAGLHFAHQEGIIHRDIKPANIMLTKKGQAVLTDFGIAQIVGSTQYTVSGALMGTLNYMAPEQGFKGECDQRSDIYSLGIVLYEMLLGYMPFDADTPLAILMKHLNDPLPLPSRVDPSLPSDLEQILLKALAKDPDDRYQSAAEMQMAVQWMLDRNLAETVRQVVPPPGGITPNAVFSGTARKQITNSGFAKEDTDPDIVSRLQAQEANYQSQYARPTNPGSPQNDTETIRFPDLGSLKIGRIKLPVIEPVTGVLGGLGIWFAMNMLALMVISITGLNPYVYGWAFELFGLSALLLMIGWGVQNVWLMVPGIIIGGNAVILAYTSISGRWGDWLFLWIFELFIIFAAVYLPKQLSNLSVNQMRAWGRVGNGLLALLAIFLGSITCWFGAIASLFH